MPKMKTKSGAAKRFRGAPAAGSSAAGVHAPHPHQEDQKRKRQLRGTTTTHPRGSARR